MPSWLSLRAALHDLDLEDSAWVEAILGEARGLFDEGLGMFVYSYGVSPSSVIHLGAVAGVSTAPRFWQALSSWGAENQRVLARTYRTGATCLDGALDAAASAGIHFTEMRPRFAEHGVEDLLTIVAHDPRGFGTFLTVPRSRVQRRTTPRERSSLERLSAELAAVTRLREHRRRRRVRQLSASEELVARRLVQGVSDKVIAAELGVTLSTVATFARRLRTKLACRPGAEALMLSERVSRPALRRRLRVFEGLTASEWEIAADLVVGASYRDIAEKRGRSVRTVASQCSALFHKCGVSGRRELAAALLAKDGPK